MAVLLLGACTCASNFPNVYRDDITAQMYEPVIEVFANCGTEEAPSNRYGTGFLIDKKHAITAKHVITCPNGLPSTMIVISPTIGNRYPVKIVRLLPELDVVKLELSLDLKLNHTAHVSEQHMTVGSVVCVVTGMLIKKCGYVIGTTKKDEMLSTIKVVKGNSGAPVYDMYGNVVGIVVRGVMEQELESVCVSINSTTWANIIAR